MRRILCLAGVVVASRVLALELGAPFGDGMVLQRGRSVPVWGWAEPAQPVVVRFAGQELESRADAKGRWRIDLAPMDASREPRLLSVSSAGSSCRVSDVLVGEVWICAGQSNCEVPLVGANPHFSDENGGMTAQLTRKPCIRYLNASTGGIATGACERTERPLVWKRFMPENLGVEPSFSAIGVYFALQLYDFLEIPIGVIGVYNGGTSIEPWIPKAGFGLYQEFSGERDWTILDGDDFARTGGMKALRPPIDDVHNQVHQQPSAIWNRRVAPLVPYAVRGMVWYQGCSNRYWPDRYCQLMHALYGGWKGAFENPEMSFYFVQLAPETHETTLIWRQQSQFEREEPHAAMVVANDLGNLHDVHPNRKRLVGVRLAAHALKRDYGFDIRDNSPSLTGWKVDGRRFVLSFKDVRTWRCYADDWSVDVGFEIAGEDGVFHSAWIENMNESARHPEQYKTDGRIVGRELIVVSDEVASPRRLRYLANAPWKGRLYNEVNLPLAAFEIGIEGK